MKVYVLTDLEGVCGLSDFDRQCWPHSPDFRQAQELLTNEVNAVVRAARDAGAQTVLVLDAHFQGNNILVERLSAGAELIQGRVRPHWLPCIEEGWDAFIQVGAHAMAATPLAVLCHSMELDIIQITLNGQPIGEIGMAAAAAGSLGIPTVLVSGDAAAAAEMRALVPQVETVVVKHAISRTAARHMAPIDACAALQAGTTRALDRLSTVSPIRISPPYTLRVSYVHPCAEYLQKKTDLHTRIVSPTTIEYLGNDLLSLFKIFE